MPVVKVKGPFAEHHCSIFRGRVVALSEIGFLVFFTIELLIKLCAYMLDYFLDGWN